MGEGAEDRGWESEQPPPIKLADAMGLMAANMQKTAGSENKHQKAPTVHSSLKNAEVTGRKSWLQVTPSRKPSQLAHATPTPGCVLSIRNVSQMLVQGSVFGVSLLVQVGQSTWVGLGQHADVSQLWAPPVRTCRCWGERGPALTAPADGDLGLCLAPLGLLPSKGRVVSYRESTYLLFSQ